MTYLPKINYGDYTLSASSINLCIFCYKGVSASTDVNSWVANQFCSAGEASSWHTADNTENTCIKVVMKTFFKSMEQFVREKREKENPKSAFSDGKDLSVFILNNHDGKSMLSCCDECAVIVNSFCDVYRQLKSLELQLEWKLESLVSIMNLANMVPSRVQTLRELFVGDKNEDGCEETSNINLDYESESFNDVDESQDKRKENLIKLDTFETMRDNMVKECALKFSKCESQVSKESVTNVESGTIDNMGIPPVTTSNNIKIIEEMVPLKSINEENDASKVDAAFVNDDSSYLNGNQNPVSVDPLTAIRNGSYLTSIQSEQEDLTKSCWDQIVPFHSKDYLSQPETKKQCLSRISSSSGSKIAQRKPQFYWYFCERRYNSYFSIQQHNSRPFLIWRKNLNELLEKTLDHLDNKGVTKTLSEYDETKGKLIKKTTKLLSETQPFNLSNKRKRSYSEMVKGL